MHCISIQIQPDFLANFNRDEFLARVRAVGRAPEIDAFTDKGLHYLQFHFFTELPTTLWQDLQNALYKDTNYSNIISPISIAVFEDENEKKPLLTLHHFDKNEQLDSLV